MYGSTEGGRAEGLAPVIPLFGASQSASRTDAHPHRGHRADSSETGAWHITWTDDARADDAGPGETGSAIGERDEDAAGVRDLAEAALLRKLRTRSLSVREARDVLAAAGVDGEAADTIVDRCLRHGYLDDVRLAEQLVFAGADRKGQGRRAIAQTLTKRGIPRELAEAALAETADDDAERALEYARHKARAFRDLDRDTAVRRLVGQLSRRGYSGQVAMSAVRTALDELQTRGVRFE